MKLLFLFAMMFCLLFCLHPGSAQALPLVQDTDYAIPAGSFYVSPTGSEIDYGRDPKLPTTLSKALNRVKDGGTIVLRGGTYHSVGKSYLSRRATLQAYPHEQVWLKGSTVVQDWVASNGVWVKDNWVYSFGLNTEASFIDSRYPMAAYRDMVYIDGVKLAQVGTLAEVTPGKFYNDPLNLKLYIGDNPTSKLVEVTTREQGIVLYSSSTSSPAGSAIKGLGFAHYAERAVAVGVENVLLENNTFTENAVTGAFYAGGSDGVVRGNTFSYNGRKGFGGDRAHGLLFESNQVVANNQERFNKSVDAAGLKIIRSHDVNVSKNTVAHNIGTGIWIDGSSYDVQIVNNVAHNNTGGGPGIWYEISDKGLIGGNLSYNNGTGIFLLDATNTRVFNNTLANNSRNIRVYDLTRENQDAAQVAAGITWISRNNAFVNNILSNSTESELFEAWNCDTKESANLAISYSDYNAYYRTSSTKPVNVIEWSLGPSKCAAGYPTIAAFSAATGYEKNAIAIDNVLVNPFFVDEANGDFRLKSDSPAIGLGVELSPELATAIGVEPGVSLDLGAYPH